MKFRSDIKVDLVQSWGTDDMIAQAARVSTGSESADKVSGLIGYLLRNAHWSPFEHCGATFRVEAPMFVRDQWVRHKSQSFSVKSLRFGEALPEFYVPSIERPLVNEGSGAHPNLVHEPDLRKVYWVQDWMEFNASRSWEDYVELLGYGVAEEVARNVLPASTYTAFYVSGNLRSWLHFLNLRITSDKSASQWEIDQAAQEVEVHLKKLFPLTMEARP